MARKVHKSTGVSKGKLNACPDMPNCVVSQYPKDRAHAMHGWKYKTEKSAAKAALIQVLKENGRATIENDQIDYVHATFKIPLFGFIDDVEFLFPQKEKVIHFRSASRIGYSDLGANKRRMKKLYEALGNKIEITKD